MRVLTHRNGQGSCGSRRAPEHETSRARIDASSYELMSRARHFPRLRERDVWPGPENQSLPSAAPVIPKDPRLHAGRRDTELKSRDRRVRHFVALGARLQRLNRRRSDAPTASSCIVDRVLELNNVGARPRRQDGPSGGPTVVPLGCNSPHLIATKLNCLIAWKCYKYRRSVIQSDASCCTQKRTLRIWGARGPEFKSRHSDHYLRSPSKFPVSAFVSALAQGGLPSHRRHWKLQGRPLLGLIGFFAVAPPAPIPVPSLFARTRRQRRRALGLRSNECRSATRPASPQAPAVTVLPPLAQIGVPQQWPVAARDTCGTALANPRANAPKCTVESRKSPDFSARLPAPMARSRLPFLHQFSSR